MNNETSLTPQKALPHNVEAETYLISSLLIDSDSFDKLLNLPARISNTDFYDKRHQSIFLAIEQLQKKNVPVDIITLTDELKNNDLLDKAGGVEYITSLIDKIPTSANVEYYGEIIKKKSMLRRMIYTCSEAISNGMDGTVEIDKLIDDTEKKIFDINEERQTTSISHIKENLYEIIEKINKPSANAGEISGVPSGYYKLDELTDGFQPSDLIVIAARPSMGKTSFALNVASKSAIKYNKRVGIFSSEMSKISLVKRMLCSGASVDQSLLRKNLLKKEDISRLVIEAESLYDATIVFDDTPNISILELRSKARRMVKDFNIEVIFIDYIQLITVEDSMQRSPRHEQIAYVSRSLKALARQLNIPVVALAQLNRDIESRGEDSRPRLSDLKDSGSIEQDADLILFIHKGKVSDAYETYNEATEQREIIIGKNRMGPTGMVNMVFNKKFTRFEILKKDDLS
jgi:replicative DNA helicase